MHLRIVGLTLIAISVILGALMFSNLAAYERVEDFALLAEDPNVKIVDMIVDVPPFNRTREEAERLGKNWGWVGFNISLPHEGMLGYQAYGVIISANPNTKVDVVMGVVNETGLEILVFDGFSDVAWNFSKVYTAASLDEKKQYQKFWFNDLDGASKYCVLFRGLKNAAEDFLILISIKESWYEEKVLFPLTNTNAAITFIILITGTSLIIFDSGRKRRKSGFKTRRVMLT